MKSFSKKITLFLFGCLVFFGLNAQIENPVAWSIQVVETNPPKARIIFTAQIQPSWHMYDMDLPEGGPVSTEFQWEEFNHCQKQGNIIRLSSAKTYHDDIFGMELRKYDKQAVFAQDIIIEDEKDFEIKGYLRYMACNESSCLPPNTIDFTIDRSDVIKQDSTLHQDTIEAAIPAENATPNKAVQSSKPQKPIATLSEISSNESLWTPVINELAAFTPQKKVADTSVWLLFVYGFLGGLLALVTPCVWPIIPMTVSFFLKRTRSRKKAIGDAVIYALSIIIIYLLLGLAITLIFGASALNSMATNALFNLLFFALLVAFALSFFGWFEIVLPSSWTNKMDSKADSTSGIWSIFFMAFTLVLVSFSCTGPIIGTLLVEAATKGSLLGPAVGMFGFALALALPFSLFAVFPNMMQSMPQSGSWLNTVKVVLGFLELAFSLKFLSVADLAYGWGIMPREIFILLWIILFITLGWYLLNKIRFRHDEKLSKIPAIRIVLAIICFGFSIYMIPGLLGAPVRAISAFAPPMSTQRIHVFHAEVEADFYQYEEGMAYAKAHQKEVLIDFSGYGCVNCRKMENAVWQDARVKDLLQNKYVLISLMVDDKTPLPQTLHIEEYGQIHKLRTIGDKWSYLQRYKFGANAQPFYVILNPDGHPISAPYSYNDNADDFYRYLKR